MVTTLDQHPPSGDLPLWTPLVFLTNHSQWRKLFSSSQNPNSTTEPNIYKWILFIELEFFKAASTQRMASNLGRWSKAWSTWSSSRSNASNATRHTFKSSIWILAPNALILALLLLDQLLMTWTLLVHELLLDVLPNSPTPSCDHALESTMIPKAFTYHEPQCRCQSSCYLPIQDPSLLHSLKPDLLARYALRVSLR